MRWGRKVYLQQYPYMKLLETDFFHLYNQEANSRMSFLPTTLFSMFTHQLRTTVNVHTQLTL